MGLFRPARMPRALRISEPDPRVSGRSETNERQTSATADVSQISIPPGMKKQNGFREKMYVFFSCSFTSKLLRDNDDDHQEGDRDGPAIKSNHRLSFFCFCFFSYRHFTFVAMSLSGSLLWKGLAFPSRVLKPLLVFFSLPCGVHIPLNVVRFLSHPLSFRVARSIWWKIRAPPRIPPFLSLVLGPRVTAQQSVLRHGTPGHMPFTP
jgi:hypothetical protein